ncbi:hypothetical protein [Lihuaxuella thermophila]|uniref:Uncharacterized protein n=1 Tax=Lihuaxuella thermophila TaxID=1173111 RepID=A0A1H8CUZ9_9BACL|nr:hypothetical protein [Lihuaxuella thermophila]SEM97987.1 hypothetical protein SAMN05444955_10494 [Lihuaxuella thermophila]
MKKVVVAIILILSLFFAYKTWFEPETNSVGGQFKIIDKKGDWIIVQSEAGEKYKVHVESEDLWLVLELNKKYALSFSKQGNEEYHLDQIVGVPKQ